MEAVIHKQIESLEKILPSWDQLKKECRAITVFQDSNWMKSWWEYKQKERKITPYIVEVKKENKTVGILPLYRYDKEFAGFSFRVLKPIGMDQSDYLIPIIAKHHSPAAILNKALQKIYADKKNWDCLDWGDIPEGSVFDSVLSKQFHLRPKWTKRKRDNVCPQLRLANDMETVKSKFNKRFLKGLLYYDRKLKREGELQFHKVNHEQEIEPVMKAFFKLHCKRWENTRTPSKFADAREREYAMQAAKGLFKSKLLYLAYLTHNDDIIVAHFGMADGKTNYLYLHAMNMEYRKYPVGHLFVYYLIQDACAEGYEVVDFLRGDEGYKDKWGTVNKHNLKYVFFSDTLKSSLFKMITNTYYTKPFSGKSPAKQLLMKTVIRGAVFVLRANGGFKQIVRG